MTGASTAPLIHLENVSRVYKSGPAEVRALDNVSLTIEHGEFVAIMGQSGSGKSTLMNILGCLDRASEGTYEISGKNAVTLPNDELARLRRETFGFVFQRYNLLATATAAENVEIPAVYAGREPRFRQARAQDLLAKLGLGDRGHHRPNELSGGQQQRVSIARALMNDPPVILADEPTGALDSQSGEDVMALLQELHAEGRTIIVITHDPEVAAFAHRQISLKDGVIIEDTGRADETRAANTAGSAHAAGGLINQVAESVKTAFRSLRANLFRTALTLLGVIIGVAAVVTMLAIGEGSRASVVERIETMGSDLLYVRPGAPGTRTRGSDNASLTYEDAMALNGVENVTAAVPERGSRATVRSGETDVSTQITGTSHAYPEARNWEIAAGSFFTPADETSYAAVAVIGQTVQDNLFPDGGAVGEFILIGGAPFEVIGTLAPRGATAWGQDQDDVVLIPITTGFMRIFGRNFISSITVRADVDERINETEAAVKAFLIERHGGQEDFQIFNTASLLETVEGTQRTFTLLLGSIAAVSLLVGGIGVMNIMLVSVSERTREIGVRMATGARRSDIMVQFNTEALVVGCLGGMIGVGIGLLCASAAGRFGMDIRITPQPAMLAFACAVATGLVFGYLPARKAARMDPVAALATE